MLTKINAVLTSGIKIYRINKEILFYWWSLSEHVKSIHIFDVHFNPALSVNWRSKHISIYNPTQSLAPKKEGIILWVKTMSFSGIYSMINKELCECASFSYYKFHRYMHKTLYFTSNQHGRNKYTMGICELVKWNEFWRRTTFCIQLLLLLYIQ